MKKNKSRAPDELPRAARGDRLSKALQLPTPAVSGVARMELNGNREVVIDGCRGVLEYDDTVVRINTGRMVVKFSGRGLSLKCLTPDSLIVEGFILMIEFIS